ncbi:hypothetical protein ACFPRL_02285 [Pseudoclavibacter helvolus]
MDPVEAEQQVTARARAGSGARRSAPRSRVKHVEVLGIDQTVSATDPRGPRPLPANHHPARLTPTECPKSPQCRRPADARRHRRRPRHASRRRYR